MPKAKDPTAALKKAFLYLGPGKKGVGYKAMFKLESSLQEAKDLAKKEPERFELGTGNWVSTRFSAEEPLPKKIWNRWLKESYAGATKGAAAKEQDTQEEGIMSHSRPTKFAHVVYRTRRFKQMLQWYKTVFGAEVMHQNPALAFLTYDDEHHRFAIADMEVIQPDGTDTERQGSIGVDHVAYTYASARDLLETYARLKEEGILPYWSVHHGITASLYYADPDGNQMEFQIDCCESIDEARTFMNAHWDANPIGVEFDPEEWLSRLRGGTPESELLQREAHEPVSPIRGEIESLLSGG